FSNTVTAQGVDDEGDAASASGSATVTYDDLQPSLSITKTASPASISEGGVGGQAVTYTYSVTNTSLATTDPVTLTSLADDKVGDLMAAFVAANGDSAVLADGATVTFAVTQTLPTANAGASYTNIVTAQGVDDEGDPASANASATVTYTDVLPSL